MLDSTLLDLPWATLVTLASGYMGYFIANVGLKAHHKTIDVAFSTLIFSLLPVAGYHAALWMGSNAYIASVPAVALAFAAGVLWRKWGREGFYRFLWKYNISWSDSTQSAWQRMFDQRGYYISQVYVYLKDGTTLLSEAPGNFEGQPCGSFVMGNERDILLYVTHEMAVGSVEWVKCKDVIHDPWGALATYIPADQITRVDIRRTKTRSIEILAGD